MAKDNVLTQKTTDHESQIKKSIKLFVGSKIEIKSKSGRNKNSICGVLADACTSVFVVRYVNNYGIDRTLSFRYAEILIGEIAASIWIDGQKVMIDDVYPMFSVNNNKEEFFDEEFFETEQESESLICC